MKTRSQTKLDSEAKKDREVVVQRYLDKPLLLDGFKFDLRVYVAVMDFNPI